MFHIGERVKGDAHRRKHKCKGSGSHTVPPLHTVLASLSEEMNGLTTEPAPRQPLRRATRLNNKGRWQSKPRAPRCVERSYGTTFEEETAFTFGESVKERKRYRTRARRQGESDNKFPLDDPPITLPSEQIFEQVTEEYSKKADELKSMGNDAMDRGSYAEAKEKYSEGMRLIMSQAPGRQRLLSKLHTNRAAAFLSENDPRSALNDCLAAKRIYPKNLRAYTRAATCCTCMGDFDGAVKILEQGSGMLNASDPHFKTIGHQITLVKELKSSLEIVALRCADGDIDEDVLSKTDDLCYHARHFERVWRLAALIELQSGRYGKLRSIEAKFQTVEGSQGCWWKWIRMEAVWWDPSQSLSTIIHSATVLIGELNAQGLTKLETTPETPIVAVDCLEHLCSELKTADRLREEGKDAVGRRSYTVAEQLYSDAIVSCEAVGAPTTFLSVLYCNRGAALHGQGRYLEAMSDVSVAICLRPDYAKAYLRLAQMHLESRNPTAAEEIAKEARWQLPRMSPHDLDALHSIEQKAIQQCQREDTTLDAYKIMGLNRSCTTGDVKKIFRKLALKLHPDKAVQFVKLKLSWMEGTPYVLKQQDKIRSRLQHRLQHLFKYLNAANSILIDEKERVLLDEELNEASTTNDRRYRYRYYESYYYSARR